MAGADLTDFLEDLRQDVLSRADLEGEERLTPVAFTERMIEDLTDIGELDDGAACYVAGRDFEVSGYDLSEEDGRLDLFTTLYTGAQKPDRLAPAAVDRAIERALRFETRARDGLHRTLEEASPAHDMTLRIADAGHIERVRVYVFTDALVRADERPSVEHDGLVVSHHVWDLERLHRLAQSGAHPEPLNVEIASLGDFQVPCIAAPVESGDYKAYLAIFPGALLASLYSTFGPRLLELNVRSYLQARGKVNAGIRRTIIEEPEHFLAYNNGIAITASNVRLERSATGTLNLTQIDDLQIVNGGQTTASIFTAWRHAKADLTRLSVAAKITVVPPHLIDEFVPFISRYANSQNKVNEADFAANDAYHVSVEHMSRSIWAPAPEGTQRQTKWFYERARGQYADALARQETPARKTQFKSEYPTAQKFTKTDLAKFEHAWEQLPHLVSRGAEKNFREFAISRGRQRAQATEEDFKDIVARAILFKSTEKLFGQLGLVGYRANVVAYSIAYLSHQTAYRIDLERIWLKQGLPGPVAEGLRTILPVVHAAITDAPGGGNVGEWAKRDKCWEQVKTKVIRFPLDLEPVLVPVGRQTAGGGRSGRLSEDDQALIARVKAVDGDIWFALSNWARQVGGLAPWQRSLAFSLGRLAKSRRDPSLKQAAQGAKILDEVARLGFRFDGSDQGS